MAYLLSAGDASRAHQRWQCIGRLADSTGRHPPSSLALDMALTPGHAQLFDAVSDEPLVSLTLREAERSRCRAAWQHGLLALQPDDCLVHLSGAEMFNERARWCYDIWLLRLALSELTVLSHCAGFTEDAVVPTTVLAIRLAVGNALRWQRFGCLGWTYGLLFVGGLRRCGSCVVAFVF